MLNPIILSLEEIMDYKIGKVKKHWFLPRLLDLSFAKYETKRKDIDDGAEIFTKGMLYGYQAEEHIIPVIQTFEEQPSTELPKIYNEFILKFAPFECNADEIGNDYLEVICRNFEQRNFSRIINSLNQNTKKTFDINIRFDKNCGRYFLLDYEPDLFHLIKEKSKL